MRGGEKEVNERNKWIASRARDRKRRREGMKDEREQVGRTSERKRRRKKRESKNRVIQARERV